MFYPRRFIRRVLPDASQLNIDGVGPSGVGAGVGHVHFIFLCRFHLRYLLVPLKPIFHWILACKASIQWNMGFKGIGNGTITMYLM